MKLTKKTNILFFGLSLLLSLVSFSGFTNQLPIEAVKTTLIIDCVNQDLSESVLLQTSGNKVLITKIKFSKPSFIRFQYAQNSYALIALKTNYIQTVGLKANNLHTVIYSTTTLKHLYQNFIV